MKSTDKFTDKAEVYAKFRPSYPLEYIEYLISKACLNENCIIEELARGLEY